MCLGVLQTLNTRYERGECKKKEQINHPNFGEAQLRRKIFNDDEQTITRKLAERRAKWKDANADVVQCAFGIQHLSTLLAFIRKQMGENAQKSHCD